MSDETTLYSKAVKELGYGMNIPDEEDLTFIAVWVSRRTDGSLTSTMCHIGEENLTDEVQKRLASGLRNIADTLDKGGE
jgi:hypothetical protein